MSIIETRDGRIEGLRVDGIPTWLGVPYAAPIVPGRRLAAPEPPLPWPGIRPATTLSAVCPQIPTYGPVGRAAASELEAGTDFLTLNIRSPSIHGKAPVLVWIHGGGYAVGSANEPVLQTAAFAASGIVEVTVNYRLGALGFLHLDGHPDNRGLLDIIAALQWVRDNIERFGGDPAEVTLAGRSAGGFAVATLMAMPAAHGLFVRAMPQSGAGIAVLRPDAAARVTQRLLDRLGAAASELEAMPFERLLPAQRDICNQSYEAHDFARDDAVTMLGVPFQPVIDGVSLPEHPEHAAASGRTAPVPMVIGCTTGEYVTHATALPEMDFALAARLLDPRVRPIRMTGDEIVRRYREALPGHSPRGIWRAVGGDLVFQNPTTRFATLHARFRPVRKYLYGEVLPDELGAPHGAEVGEVWFRPGMDMGRLPPRQQVRDPALAARVHALWVSAVADDEPGLPDGSSWTGFGAENPHVCRLASGTLAMGRDVFADRLELWKP